MKSLGDALACMKRPGEDDEKKKHQPAELLGKKPEHVGEGEPSEGSLTVITAEPAGGEASEGPLGGELAGAEEPAELLAGADLDAIKQALGKKPTSIAKLLELLEGLRG